MANDKLEAEVLAKSAEAKARYEELGRLLVTSEVISDNKKLRKLSKERASLEEIVEGHNRLQKLCDDLDACERDMQNETDSDLKDMFYAEIGELKEKIASCVEEVKDLLIPKDEADDNNVIIEIRSAAGGEESSLFCSVLMRMYCCYADSRRWKWEVLDLKETELGGIKEVTFLIKGHGAYSRLKFESGVHRVQRVPETESQGRIHTSTSTVAVLPEVEDIDVEINDSDIKIDTYRSSGAGGQHVNKTESAIRITHFPTGIVVACQDERSQIKNRERAMSILRAKVYDYYKQQQDAQLKGQRKSQVGTGDRSERIRTYNYPQGRVTDHRIGLTSYNLEGVLGGDLDQFIDALIIWNRDAQISAND